MIEVPIRDRAMTGGCSITGYPPTKMKWKWNWNPRERQKVVVFTDRAIEEAELVSAERKIALLIEPRKFVDEVGFLTARRLLDKLDYVLTYDRSVIQLFGSKALWYPIAGCWIPYSERHLNHQKTKLVSVVASTKRNAPGHALRHQAVEALQGVAEIYGRAYRPIEFKTEAHGPFMFSVVAENGKVETMFTEKIIDCFVTGCVPIYYGCKTICNYFRSDGILEIDCLEDLKELLPYLTPERYRAMIPAIMENFERAKSYLVAEDWICEHYPFLFV